MSFNNTESFCTMTMSVFYRKVLRLDVGMISWANLKCMNIVKLSVNQWTSIFPPSSPVWLNATCTLAVTDGGQRSAMLLSRTPDDDTLPHWQQQGSTWRSRGLSQTFPPSLYVCSPIAPTKSSPGGDQLVTTWPTCPEHTAADPMVWLQNPGAACKYEHLYSSTRCSMCG